MILSTGDIANTYLTINWKQILLIGLNNKHWKEIDSKQFAKKNSSNLMFYLKYYFSSN